MDSTTTGPTQSTIDTCSYSLHFPSTVSSSSDSLSQLHSRIQALVQSITKDYIWHKQPFNLSLSPLSFSPNVAVEQQRFLLGSTEVTDCVDDEWFIVYLLKEISNTFKEVVISVEDEDGQFLLIEAAEVLPNWITPNNAENRVWIHQGRFHLVPLQHVSSLPFDPSSSSSMGVPSFEQEEQQQGFIDRNTAIELVRDPSIDTLAPKHVEKLIWDRINSYPGQIEKHLHKTLTYLPIEIALALADTPALISEAIAAFYEREPSTLKACNIMKRFPPSSPSSAFRLRTSQEEEESTVETSTDDRPKTILIPTTMTRPLYSQLVMQRFFAPKPFDKVGWTNAKFGKEDERRREVGMKIACGFEMLYQSTSLASNSSSSTNSSPDLTHDPKYQTFVKSLTSLGYFDSELPGSTKYTSLESKAKQGYLHSLSVSSSSDREPFSTRVERAIERSRVLLSKGEDVLSDRIEKLFDEEKMREFEDEDDWLSLDEQGLEELLRSKEGKFAWDEDLLSDDEEDEDSQEGDRDRKDKNGMEIDGEEERKATKAAERLRKMANKVEQFVEGKGSLQGATFEDEESEDDEEEDEESAVEMDDEEKAKRVRELVKGLGEGEWGAKETFDDGRNNKPTGNDVVPPPISRPPKLTPNKYDGASSDDELSSDDEVDEGQEGLGSIPGMEGIDEGEDAPTVEMDMQEEVDEFLKFATETLGLSEEQYQDILKERQGRGAFVPGPAKAKKVNIIPSLPEASSAAKEERPRRPTEKPTVPIPPLRNPNLADFDALMSQMDSELAKARGLKSSTTSTSTATKAKLQSRTSAKATPLSSSKDDNSSRIVVDSESEDDDDDDVAAMDEELASLFKSLPGSEDNGGEPMDLNLVKNFLESFQSQGGFGGPAGNLSGRLGFPLPKNLHKDDQ